MPITPSIRTERISQEQFKQLAFEVMNHVFAIHNEFGRLFNEQIYKRELACRMSDTLVEVPVDVTHRSFVKRYFADVIVRRGGLFEFKAADAIHPRHRGQTINYLLLFDLGHAKIVNVRPERVQHEFVNCQQRLHDLRDPAIHDREWEAGISGAALFRDTLTDLIHDWGSGLELALYEEALIHFFGGEESVSVDTPVFGTAGQMGQQRMNLVRPVSPSNLLPCQNVTTTSPFTRSGSFGIRH